MTGRAGYSPEATPLHFLLHLALAEACPEELGFGAEGM